MDNDLFGMVLSLLHENGEADDLVWLLSDKPGMVGRLKYMRAGMTRVKLQIDNKIFDWKADVSDLDGFSTDSDEQIVTVVFFLPGMESDYEVVVDWATDIAQRFLKVKPN